VERFFTKVLTHFTKEKEMFPVFLMVTVHRVAGRRDFKTTLPGRSSGRASIKNGVTRMDG